MGLIPNVLNPGFCCYGAPGRPQMGSQDWEWLQILLCKMVFNKRWFTGGSTPNFLGRGEGGREIIWDYNLPRVQSWERPRWKAEELKWLQIPSGTLPSEFDGFIKDTEARASWGTQDIRRLIMDDSTVFSWMMFREILQLHEGCSCPIKKFSGSELNF